LNVASFISDINLWFDIFNSYAPYNKLSNKNAFGINLESQMAHLDKIIKLTENMKPIGKQYSNISKGHNYYINQIIKISF
jgi:hypothetical protein